MSDTYSAIWVSHSSIEAFLACPRAYFLRHLYKDPHTNRKISLITPALALGQAVHEVIESLSKLPVEERFNRSLLQKLDDAWQKVTGRQGGFHSQSQEEHYLELGRQMLRRADTHRGPLERKAVKIKTKPSLDLPYFWLSQDEEIILCGKIDWLEYLPDDDSVKILDFKTGVKEQSPDSLQLPIYYLLASHCQHRPVTGASYWYLRHHNLPSEQQLPDLDQASSQVLAIAKRIKLARKLRKFDCPHGGCRHCDPYEAIMAGRATKVGISDIGHQLYALFEGSPDDKPEGSAEADSQIL
ncbi:MAG: hypothetical protein COU69_03130 [Candidatus Pacebacteria bacterium CG10_big_fil_rev_8_21_14_0_10_56_10]|nr:MAG: hypothetical protein COU69_03130 [Candidatus Pacebacteria bacterium CG10_big_fil_rev_8_21_14_0_10_56_10]